MTTTQDWIAGSRPRTLWTAISAVTVGTGAAVLVDGFRLIPALLALVVGLAMQIAVNYANDYSDGVRGTDMDRVGPDRLVATGRATPSAVRNAAFLSFAVAAIAGLALVALTETWWLLAVGAVAIVAAWAYTGTSKPYGYAGWGEIVAFLFFGPVATLGTLYTQAGEITWWAIVASVGVGLYSVALMLVNNIRDIATDTVAGKRTLPVRIGEARARRLFMAVVMAPTVCSIIVAFVHPWVLISTMVALPSLLIAFGMRIGVEKIGMPLIFKGLSAVGLSYGLLLGIGLML